MTIMHVRSLYSIGSFLNFVIISFTRTDLSSEINNPFNIGKHFGYFCDWLDANKSSLCQTDLFRYLLLHQLSIMLFIIHYFFAVITFVIFHQLRMLLHLKVLITVPIFSPFLMITVPIFSIFSVLR